MPCQLRVAVLGLCCLTAAALIRSDELSTRSWTCPSFQDPWDTAVGFTLVDCEQVFVRGSVVNVTLPPGQLLLQNCISDNATAILRLNGAATLASVVVVRNVSLRGNASGLAVELGAGVCTTGVTLRLEDSDIEAHTLGAAILAATSCTSAVAHLSIEVVNATVRAACSEVACAAVTASVVVAATVGSQVSNVSIIAWNSSCKAYANGVGYQNNQASTASSVALVADTDARFNVVPREFNIDAITLLATMGSAIEAVGQMNSVVAAVGVVGYSWTQTVSVVITGARLGASLSTWVAASTRNAPNSPTSGLAAVGVATWGAAHCSTSISITASLLLLCDDANATVLSPPSATGSAANGNVIACVGIVAHVVMYSPATVTANDVTIAAMRGAISYIAAAGNLYGSSALSSVSMVAYSPGYGGTAVVSATAVRVFVGDASSCRIDAIIDGLAALNDAAACVSIAAAGTAFAYTSVSSAQLMMSNRSSCAVEGSALHGGQFQTCLTILAYSDSGSVVVQVDRSEVVMGSQAVVDVHGWFRYNVFASGAASAAAWARSGLALMTVTSSTFAIFDNCTVTLASSEVGTLTLGAASLTVLASTAQLNATNVTCIVSLGVTIALQMPSNFFGGGFINSAVAGITSLASQGNATVLVRDAQLVVAHNVSVNQLCNAYADGASILAVAAVAAASQSGRAVVDVSRIVAVVKNQTRIVQLVNTYWAYSLSSILASAGIAALAVANRVATVSAADVNLIAEVQVSVKMSLTGGGLGKSLLVVSSLTSFTAAWPNSSDASFTIANGLISITLSDAVIDVNPLACGTAVATAGLASSGVVSRDDTNETPTVSLCELHVTTSGCNATNMSSVLVGALSGMTGAVPFPLKATVNGTVSISSPMAPCFAVSTQTVTALLALNCALITMVNSFAGTAEMCSSTSPHWMDPIPLRSWLLLFITLAPRDHYALHRRTPTHSATATLSSRLAEGRRTRTVVTLQNRTRLSRTAVVKKHFTHTFIPLTGVPIRNTTKTKANRAFGRDVTRTRTRMLANATRNGGGRGPPTPNSSVPSASTVGTLTPQAVIVTATATSAVMAVFAPSASTRPGLLSAVTRLADCSYQFENPTFVAYPLQMSLIVDGAEGTLAGSTLLSTVLSTAALFFWCVCERYRLRHVPALYAQVGAVVVASYLAPTIAATGAVLASHSSHTSVVALAVMSVFATASALTFVAIRVARCTRRLEGVQKPSVIRPI